MKYLAIFVLMTLAPAAWADSPCSARWPDEVEGSLRVQQSLGRFDGRLVTFEARSRPGPGDRHELCVRFRWKGGETRVAEHPSRLDALVWNARLLREGRVVEISHPCPGPRRGEGCSERWRWRGLGFEPAGDRGHGGHGGPGRPGDPPGPPPGFGHPQAPPPPPIATEAEVEGLRQSIDRAPFREDKLRVVRGAVSLLFTVDQVARLVEKLPFSDDRVEAIRVLFPRIVDKHQQARLYELVPFGRDREALERALAPLQ